MNKNIRLITPSELPMVAILDRRVNKTPWSMVQYEDCLANRNQQIYVVEINRIICGFLVVSVMFDEVEILQLAIDRPYQNQKLAKYLITHVLACLDDRYMISKVFLEVSAENNSAIALYKKLGFNLISTRKNYYLVNGARFDALVMMLDYAKS
jgi:[ribosomal protein S18]-alanine N-acetyltransferase